MSKLLDFFDTFFIVIRRKWRQLSFLHVYHHASIVMVSWLFQRTAFDGDIFYTMGANSLIHTIMYGYYLARLLNVPLPKIIKMMVTNMQIFQFLTMLVQAIYLWAYSCPYPQRMNAFYFVYICSMLVLFVDFANTNYKKPSGKAKQN